MAGLKMNVEFPTRLVEFNDGVRCVDPVSIKFCDEENANLCALVKHNEALRNGEANVENRKHRGYGLGARHSWYEEP